jgi:prepilin-type N-terminal cleavage/methylation domain-containing protein
MTQTHNAQYGFTFIELIVVVALILTISIASTGFYARFFTQNAASNAVDQITSSLRKAQIYSMMGKQNSQWGVKYTANKIILFQGSSYATRNAVFDESFTVPNSVNVVGLNEIVFYDLTGTPSATATISISGGNTNKSIIINSQGTVNR